MLCLIKEIKPDEEQDCKSEATGMFKTLKGNYPLCQPHADWAKFHRIVIKRRDNYYGDL